MNNHFIKIYFIVIITLVLVFNIIQFYQTSPTVSADISAPNFHFSESSDFIWPLPRIS